MSGIILSWVSPGGIKAQASLKLLCIAFTPWLSRNHGQVSWLLGAVMEAELRLFVSLVLLG